MRPVNFPPADVETWNTAGRRSGGSPQASAGAVSRQADRTTGSLGRARSGSRVSGRARTERRMAHGDVRSDARIRRATWRRRCSTGPPFGRTPHRDPFRATISNTRCSHSARCMRAFRLRPSRRLIHWSLPISESCGSSSTFLTPGLVFVAERRAVSQGASKRVLPPDAELVISGDPGRIRTLHAFSRLKTPPPPKPWTALTPPSVPTPSRNSSSPPVPPARPKASSTRSGCCAAIRKSLRTMLPFVTDDPPVLCDWLPWNHTFAGNHDFGLVLYNGGSYYIDDGRPVAGAHRSHHPQSRRRPAQHLSERAARVRNGSAISARARANFAIVSSSSCGSCITRARVFRSRYGTSCRNWRWNPAASASSCSPASAPPKPVPPAMFPYWEEDRAGHVGLPAPGVELKLVKAGQKTEARLRSPSITPGYWRQPELTRAAFDEEGFYCLGDALLFVDPERSRQRFHLRRPHRRGFQARHRHLGQRRTAARQVPRHCAPYLRDIVFAGHDGDYVAALIFPNVEACRALVAGRVRCGDRAQRAGSREIHEAASGTRDNQHRQFQPRGARHADGRAALHRQARGHRQRLV